MGGRRKLPSELKASGIAYRKRKNKAQEFATLCDVDMCMIIYGPAGSADAKLEVWPASPKKVKCIIEWYMSEGGDRRAKRTVWLPESFVNQNGKVDKARLANWEAKCPISEALIGGLSKEDLRRLSGSLGHKVEEAKARLAVMREDAMRRSSHTYDRHVHANDH